MTPNIKALFDRSTSTVTYIVSDPHSESCVIIDSVLDYDPKSGRTDTASADRVVDYVRSSNLRVERILETHAHADHLSGAPYLQDELGGSICIGARIVDVQAIFKDIFNIGTGFATDGSQFDELFQDGDVFSIGSLKATVMHTPGHTPACLTYLIGDAAFIGDTLFMPDYGTARADFPGGDAATLYRSIQKILALPDETRLFLCHDYLSKTRTEYAWETTVREEKLNVHLAGDVAENEYVAMRNERDNTLSMPVLLLPSVQINIRAGNFPPPESNGVSYIKIPINLL